MSSGPPSVFPAVETGSVPPWAHERVVDVLAWLALRGHPVNEIIRELSLAGADASLVYGEIATVLAHRDLPIPACLLDATVAVPRGRNAALFGAIPRDRLASEYAEVGRSKRALALRHGVDRSTVRDRLRREGIDGRGSTDAPGGSPGAPHGE